MKGVDTIARVRREHFVRGRSIKEISRDLHVSRNTVRKILRSGETQFSYERDVQPMPKIGPWQGDLDRLLLGNDGKPARERLTLIRIFEEMRGLGFEGGYDAIRRYAKGWSRERGALTAEAYVPLSFEPGEAYQFDWSYEVVRINNTTVTIKVAHVRLCHSRMFFVRAYPRETQEMLFDAHAGRQEFAACINLAACVRLLQGGLHARHLRHHEDRGGCDLYRPIDWYRFGSAIQPALPADVLALSGRTHGLHAGIRLGKGPSGEPGRAGA
jgi:hypothetical protein